jgi:hypothetical protein
MKAKLVGFIAIIIAGIAAILFGLGRSAANSVTTLTDAEMAGLRGGLFQDCHQPEDNCPATACAAEGTGGSYERFSNYFRVCASGIHNCDWASQQVDCKTAHYLPPNNNCAGVPDSYGHDMRNQCIVS